MPSAGTALQLADEEMGQGVTHGEGRNEQGPAGFVSPGAHAGSYTVLESGSTGSLGLNTKPVPEQELEEKQIPGWTSDSPRGAEGAPG